MSSFINKKLQTIKYRIAKTRNNKKKIEKLGEFNIVCVSLNLNLKKKENCSYITWLCGFIVLGQLILFEIKSKTF